MSAPQEQPRINTAKIRQLNDEHRKHLVGKNSYTSRGVTNHPAMEEIIRKVREFNSFNMANDPFDEHDFGAFEIGEDTFYWKFDYYGSDMDHGSPDASDPKVTTRVLTILLDSEW
jgi:hypothetical protein